MFKIYKPINEDIEIGALLITENNVKYLMNYFEEKSIPFGYSPEGKTFKLFIEDNLLTFRFNKDYLIKYTNENLEESYSIIDKDLFEKLFKEVNKESFKEQDIKTLLNGKNKTFTITFRDSEYRHKNKKVKLQIGDHIILKKADSWSDNYDFFEIIGYDKKAKLLLVLMYNSKLEKVFLIINPMEYQYISKNPYIKIPEKGKVSYDSSWILEN